jgi:NADH-quinone oxidoreductase subunit C
VDTVDIWPTANWHEREIYDMMGIKFTGIPISVVFNVDGYPSPLRKDFPLKASRAKCPVAFTKVTPWKAVPL